MISNVVEISNLIALKAPVSIPRDSNLPVRNVLNS